MADKMVEPTPSAGTKNATLAGSEITVSFYLDATGRILTVQVKSNDGATVRTGTIPLT